MKNDHLSRAVRLALDSSNEERIARVRSPRWIGYPMAKRILDRLEDLLTYPRTHRMPGLLLVGETNNGKTMIINRFRQLHPARDNPDGEATTLPVLIVQAPPGPSEGRLYDTIMEKVGCPFRHNASPGRKQFQVVTLLRRVDLRLLIIDEIQHVLAGSLLQQHNFLNTIKHLSNELQIPIVGVGTKEAFNAIQSDPQLANRFEPVFLPRWSISDGLKPETDPYLQLLASFECLLPLNRPSHLTQPALALKILSLSEGLIGEVSAILTKAAVKAIGSGKERIDLRLLEQIQFTSPSDRKWRADAYAAI
ncbi:MAG TPA: TniB family NTP-binding protein [Candidatus Dormibacteraeota bacterium]|nr:TniB family NTP-binding protein [Candidatus Dormibacteraeota bacterium]